MTVVRLKPGQEKKLSPSLSYNIVRTVEPWYFRATLKERRLGHSDISRDRTTCPSPFLKMLTIRDIYGFRGGRTVGRWKAGRYLMSMIAVCMQ
jgi:hypothetical protein